MNAILKKKKRVVSIIVISIFSFFAECLDDFLYASVPYNTYNLRIIKIYANSIYNVIKFSRP